MKLRFEDGELVLLPESDADRAELVALFGTVRKDSDSRGKREFSGPAYGRDVYMRDDDEAVYVGAANAWWDYDD